MNYDNCIIQTSRLSLMPPSKKYATDIFREFTPEIARYMYPKPPKSIEDTYAFITDSLAKRKKGVDLTVVIVNTKSGEFIGCGGIHDIGKKEIELGIWIKKSAHGNKYGQETVKALFDWANKNLDFESILYHVAKENISSRKIAELLGGKVIREFQKTNCSGITNQMVEYKIDKISTT